MDLTILIVLIMATIAAFCIFVAPRTVEGMTGYGTLSGLAYNSKGLYCFKNIYDPPGYDGYCTTIGKVVV